METKRDQSYGVIPIHKTSSGTWEVLVMNQISLRKDVYWTFPKGHPEGNETPEAAALRELREETGLSAGLDTSRTFEHEYTFPHEGMHIEKSVTYFVGWVDDTAFELDPTEVTEAAWLSFPDAYERLTHERSKATLGEVEKYLLSNQQ